MPETTAKAAVLAGPRKVEVREVPVGGPAPSEVQIATLFSGISAGTEMNMYRGNAPQWQLRRDPSTKLSFLGPAPQIGAIRLPTVMPTSVELSRRVMTFHRQRWAMSFSATHRIRAW